MGHTPGPWVVREPDADERLADIAEGRSPEDMELTEVYADDGGQQVCYVMNDTPDEAANARLIAAAPEMLAALYLASNALDYAQAQVDSERDAVAIRSWRRDVDRAIDKAEGRADEATPN